MYQLVCDANLPTDRDIYEHFYLFQPNPRRILQRIKRFKSVKFNVPGADGTQTLEYVPDDHASLNEFIKKIPLENTPSTCNHRALKRSIEDAISAQRKEYKSIFETDKGLITGPFGFDSIDSFNIFDDSIRKLKIFAIEHTERADPWINPYYGNADPAFVISHLDSLLLLERPVATSQMTVIELEGGVASSHFTLAMALLVDLLRCLQRTQCLRCVNALMKLVPHDRFVRFLNEKGYTLAQGDSSKFLDSVYKTLLRKSRSSTPSPPANVGDFLVNFSVFAGQLHGLSQVTNARSLAANKLRLDPSDPSQLQISFIGGDEYYAISLRMLSRYVSTARVPDLIIKVLSTPGNEVYVPPGHRNSAEADDIVVDVDLPSDCVKQAFLNLPAEVLSPIGKERAKRKLPNWEIGFDDLYDAASRDIRSVNIKNTPRDKDPHQFAMSSNSILIGTAIIEGSSRSHAVVIDGTRGERGIIFDPHEGFGEVERTPAGLQKLGIESFSQAYEIQRNEISKKKRVKLQRDTGLPFVSD
jgi:hypothetical protein